MYTKKLRVIFLCMLFFIFIFCIQAAPYFKDVLFYGVYDSYLTALLNLTGSLHGYHSVLSYTILYVAPFLIFYHNFFLRDNLVSFFRYKSRNIFYLNRCFHLCIAAFLFTALHIIVSILFTFYLFPFAILDEHNFLFVSFCNLLVVWGYFMLVGFIYSCLADMLFSTTVALCLTAILFILFYFVDSYVLLSAWTPLKDLIVYSKILDGSWSVVDVFYVWVRQILLLFSVGFAGIWIVQRKDVFHEN